MDETKWILAIDRQPRGKVLCCDIRGEMMLGYVYRDEYSDTLYSAKDEDRIMYDCVAWMLLPEPYKEG